MIFASSILNHNQQKHDRVHEKRDLQYSFFTHRSCAMMMCVFVLFWSVLVSLRLLWLLRFLRQDRVTDETRRIYRIIYVMFGKYSRINARCTQTHLFYFTASVFFYLSFQTYLNYLFVSCGRYLVIVYWF